MIFPLIATSATATGFDGSFEFRWLSEPRNRHRMMQLLAPVSFTDAKGKVWSVPAGWKIDGASIPRFFWTAAGSPFDGNYRRASVIHDYYCDVDTEFTRDTHDMFKEASLADGVDWATAYAMRLAVGVGGTGCGKSDPPNVTFYDLNTVIVPGRQGEFADTLKQLEMPSSRFRSYSLTDRKLQLDGLVTVSKPLTYDATVKFRQTPTEENFKALQDAISAEQPTDDDVYRIESLVISISPDAPSLMPEAR